MRKAAESFATLAIIGADPTFNAVFGDTTSLAEAWSGSPLLNMSFDDWMKCHLREPLPLRLQECEATIRQSTGKSSDPAVATPSSSVLTNPDAEDRSSLAETLEELKAALTQLLATTMTDGISPVKTSATQSTAPAFMPTCAPIFAAPQGPATPPTAASPTPFCFTGGTPGSTKVRVKATAPTTAFPFDAPVVGYKGLTTGDVQRSESAKPCCTRTCRLRKSRVQWLKGLPKAFRLRSIKACHLGRLRVLQGREQSQNRALLQSAKAGCSETHVRQNKSKKNSTPGFAREELRPGYPDWRARTGASGEERKSIYREDRGAAGVQSAATESTTLPDFTQYPGLARLKITLLPHDGHAPPARNILRLPPLPAARTGVAANVPEVRDLSHGRPAAAEPTTPPGSTLPTALRPAPQPTAARPTTTMRDFSHLTWVYGRRGLYNHIQTSQLVGPEADILEYNVIGRSGFSPRIRGHEYYAPLKFDSIHSARQWARENSQRNRPIFWKANERMGEVGTTCNLMNDVDALRGLQEFIAAGARGTIADGRPLHFDIPGITDGTLTRGYIRPAADSRLRFVHSHYPHQWTHQVLTRHQAPATTDSNAKWLEWFTAPDDQVLQSTTGTSRGLAPWSSSRAELARVRSYLLHYLNTVKGRPYHRHAPGHGRAHRLRGSLLDEGDEGGSPTKASKQSGTARVSTAAVIDMREGGESAVSTTGGLDSSFAASTASTRRSGDREGGGQEEEGASNHAEEEGGSYTEGEGTIEGRGSSIRGSGGESFLSEQVGLVGMLIQLLHWRRHPSGRSRSHPLRPQRTVRLSALQGRWGGTRVRSYQGDGWGETSGDRSREAIKRVEGGRGGQCRSPWVVLCMTRGCTDGTGPWPTLEP